MIYSSRRRAAAARFLPLVPILALAAGACRSLGSSGAPGPVAPAASALFARARAAVEAPGGDQPAARDEARVLAVRALAAEPGWVAPRRFLDDLLLRELRGPEALAEHLRHLALEPGDAGRLYLAGRLEGDAGAPRFEAAVRAARELGWGHHGLAWSHGRAGRGGPAARHERRALERASSCSTGATRTFSCLPRRQRSQYACTYSAVGSGSEGIDRSTSWRCHPSVSRGWQR